MPPATIETRLFNVNTKNTDAFFARHKMQNPQIISEKAKKIVLDLLPVKSRQIYEKEYEAFIRWKEMNNIVIVDEYAMLNYLHEKSQEVKPSALWSKYLSVKENIEINKFARVIAFLKRNSVGYELTKSKVLTRQEINTFLINADDEKYLLIKVALLIGVCGACWRAVLHSLKIQDIVQRDTRCLLITIPDTKTNIKRVFPVVAEGEAVNTLELYQKYVRLRPANVKQDNFFY